MCPEGSSQWGLITDTRQYAVFGKTSELKNYERQRVTVTGNVTPAVAYPPIDSLQVQSIAASSVDEHKIRQWIEQLRSNRWKAPEDISNPTFWLFHFTPPMIHILLAGPAAQNVLLDYVNDPQIKDQAIFLLGGAGDAKAVEPIINAMESPDEVQASAYARKVNLAANLALTNITVSGVIWHHGGGITRDNCPKDPKSCWSAWWLRHRDTFDISNTYERRYSNYPDYGIYQYPGQYRSESFIQNAEK